ncbi:hypothetical protein IMSHALPRED_010546 [Imshaugia aleurites]|uniref:Heterokaryon incompatibility domain-containing protein n=1 Tax=Imshaugia aleurites TaxID=172621 RepID=A0A8H3EU38_9LECA|nr:hypothetical protein IMSHALPRED_010546 [Imshaugia aleurites]
MRLVNTSTLQLHEFVGSDIPRYAILSHTWEEGEFLFPNMANLEALHLPGFAKVSKFCERARSESLEFAWMDTCCIDKSSSAELSEAINSMYEWYRRASVCYVYLSDVSVLAQNDDEKADGEKRFQDCRWFTRGWTLQELLAPQYVKFFDKDWIYFGSRRSLVPDLVSTTGIDATHLERPHWASIATRMSWASSRKTTRVEDIAYCLLGLFEVNMPLLYGEGEKAFQRLQHEILKASDDESIFAWRNESLVHSGMLALSPADFSDSGDVGPNTISRQSPSAMTNRGLKIVVEQHLAYKIPMNECDPGMNCEVHLVELACEFLSTKKPVMILLRAFLSGSTYKRTGTSFAIGAPSQEGIEALGCYKIDKPETFYVSSTNYFNMNHFKNEALYIPTIIKLCPMTAEIFAIIRDNGNDGGQRWQRTASSDDVTLTLQSRLKEPETLRLSGSHDWILEIDLKSDFIQPDPITSAQDMMFCRVRLYKSGQRPEDFRTIAWPEDAVLGNGGDFAAELAEKEYLWLGLSPGHHRQYCRDSGEVDSRCWIVEIEISSFDRAKVLGSRSARLGPSRPILYTVL